MEGCAGEMTWPMEALGSPSDEVVINWKRRMVWQTKEGRDEDQGAFGG